MHTKVRFGTRSLLHIAAVAGFVSVVPLCSASAAQSGDEVVNHVEAQAREAWRGIMHETSAPSEGCFHASYPSTQWQEVECAAAPGYRSALPKAKDREQTVGNGYDYVVQVPSGRLLNSASGTFPTVTGVKSEKSVGVAAFGDGGILGPNEYSLQLNTNLTDTTAACDGHSDCVVWQQFIYATDYVTDGEAAVFMQYWLIGWGDSACPSGFGSDGEGDCYGNSNYVAAPDVKPTSLAKLSLSAAAKAGSKDTVVFTDGTTAYSVSGSDSVLDISKVWHQSEFNVVGDAGGSRADFNEPVSITVKLALTDGSTSAPTCVANAGSTGETNNLDLGKCSTASGSSPSIEFIESN